MSWLATADNVASPDRPITESYGRSENDLRLHLGDISDGMLIGALGIIEMALSLAGVPHNRGGVQAAWTT